MKLNTIQNIDCTVALPKINSESVDLVLTDPPFAIDFKAIKSNYHRKQSKVLRGYNEVPEEKYEEFTFEWMTEAKRIMKSSGSIYVFSGYNNVDHIIHAAKDLFGYDNFQQLIWQYSFGVRTARKFVTAHYNIIYAWKNEKKKFFNLNCRFNGSQRTATGGSARYADMESVWKIKKEYWSGRQKTPTKLPSEVIRKILQYSSKKNDIICDPFLGSGQVAVVSKQMGRNYIGFEKVKNYYNFASKRLAQVK